MENFVTPCKEGEPTRKRKVTPKNWKRNRAKVLRYSSKALPKFPACTHSKGALLCKNLSCQDIRKFHEKFYNLKDKIDQDNFILKYVSSVPTKRRRPTTNTYKKQDGRAKYFVPKNQEMIPVCYNTFLGILHVSRFRVNNIMKKFRESGSIIVEKRGGDRVSEKYKHRKKAVLEFINLFKCSEPHYCNVHTGRKYLPAELSIKKMWRMFNNSVADNNLKVEEWYFRDIFNRNYNLGFGSPRVDVCSTCLQLEEKLKSNKDNEIEKNEIITTKRIHKLRAKAFFQLLKENDPKICTVSFDCQKNLPLPKLPDQATYYSRQFYLYNFTIVTGHSKSKLGPENVTSYVWLESDFSKGSNEIASCLFNHLKDLNLTEDIECVRLVCDGCAGQNKNTTLLSMISYWLAVCSPINIKEVELVFPVTGHSFLPADRVFGLIEKEIS